MTFSTPSPSLFSALTTHLQQVTDRIVPPARRSALFDTLASFYSDHPFLSTFLAAQLAFSGLPILVFSLFIVGVFLLSVVTALVIAVLVTGLWAGLALLVLVPVVLGTMGFATLVWAWGWAGWVGLRAVGGYLGWFPREETREGKEKLEDEGERKAVTEPDPPMGTTNGLQRGE